MERTQCLAAHVVGRVLAGRSLDSELTAVWRQHATLSPQQQDQLNKLKEEARKLA